MITEQRQLSARFLIYKFVSNLWFLSAVWLYFYRIYITDQQVGFLDGMAFLIGIIAEVPSGALADRFGRARMTKLGVCLSGLGIIMQAAGSSFTPFFVGQAILMIGIAFVSGADEALFFEKLRFERNSAHWRKLMTRGSQAALAATILATVIGGWLHTINPRLPWFTTGFAFLFSTIALWPLTDAPSAVRQTKVSEELKHYFRNIKEGFTAFRAPKLWIYVPIIATVQGLFYIAGFGILRIVLLDRFGFSPSQGALVVASSAIMTIGLLHLMHKKAENLSEKWVITSIAISAAVALLISLLDVGTWGYVIILVLYAGEHLLYPFMSETLNYHAPDKQRATILSVANFIRALPYVVLAPLIGWLSSTGHLNYFLFVWPACIALSVAMYVANKRKDSKITISE